MLIYKKGDVLKSSCNIICHQVNTKGIFGGGLAYQIKQSYPQCEKDAMAIAEINTLGIYGLSKINDTQYIANCFSQNSDYSTNYIAMRTIFESLLTKCKENNYSICCPYKYGCGIASGDWEIVVKILEDIFIDYDLYIYELEALNEN